MEKKSFKRADTLKEKGNASYSKNKFSEAAHFYYKAIEACPTDNKLELAELRNLRAGAYEKLKAWNQVQYECSKSLKYYPYCADTYFMRAKAHQALNELGNCLNDATLAALLEGYQKDKIGETISNYVESIAFKRAKNSVRKHVAKRNVELPSKLLFKTYFESLAFDPIKKETPKIKNPKGYLKAKAALNAKNFKDIIPACTEEINLPDSKSNYKTEALLLRAVFYIFSGNLKDGLLDFEEVIRSKADDQLRIYALIKRAPILIQLEETEAGFDDFNEAEKLSSNNIDLYNFRGWAYIFLNQFSDALKDFQKALKLEPNNVVLYLNKYHAQYFVAVGSKNYTLLSKTMKKIKSTVDKFPNCLACYRLMTLVLCYQKQFKEADLYFEKANKISPETPDLYVHRGIMILQWKNDEDKAYELIRKAIELDDKCSVGFKILARIEYHRGNMLEAVELCNKAVSLSIFPIEITSLFALRNVIVAEIKAKKIICAQIEEDQKNNKQQDQKQYDQKEGQSKRGAFYIDFYLEVLYFHHMAEILKRI